MHVGVDLNFRSAPHRTHREMVHRSDLLHGQELTGRPLAWVDGLAVDPARCVGVPLHLHVLTQLLGANGTTVVQQLAHPAEESVLPSSAVEWCASWCQRSDQTLSASVGDGRPPRR